MTKVVPSRFMVLLDPDRTKEPSYLEISPFCRATVIAAGDKTEFSAGERVLFRRSEFSRIPGCKHVLGFDADIVAKETAE